MGGEAYHLLILLPASFVRAFLGRVWSIDTWELACARRRQARASSHVRLMRSHDSQRTTSAAILGSSSTAINFLHSGRARIVKFPVPGPTSRTVSVGCIKAFCTIAWFDPRQYGFLGDICDVRLRDSHPKRLDSSVYAVQSPCSS